eukprot:gene5663-6359_t
MHGVENWWKSQSAKDVHATLRKREAELPTFNTTSSQICYRRSLVNWLAVLSEKYGLTHGIVHLAVSYIDHVMESYELLMESQLNMLALCCLSLAAKIEECEDNIPRVPTLKKHCKESFDVRQFIDMEMAVSQCLNWRLILPTAASFMEYYVLESLGKDDLHAGEEISSLPKARSFLLKYTEYFVEVSLQDYTFLQFLPSLISSASVYTARHCLQLTPEWPTKMVSLTGYSCIDMDKCKTLLLRIHDIDARKSNNISNGQ